MKPIKLIISIAVLITISLSSYGQQQPVFNLYQHMKIVTNPAFTAENELVSAFLDARNQWTGIIGAPKTRAFGLHGAINDKMKIGGYIVDDKYGLIDNLTANLSYAYKIKLNEDHNLTLGLAAMLNECSFNMSEVKVGDYNDVVLTMSGVEGVAFDAGFGLKYSWKKLDLAFSIPQLLETKIKYTSPENNDYFFDLRRHLNVYMGYYINTKNKKLAFEPSILFRSARKSPNQLDINFLTHWDQKYWMGLAYRNSGRTWVESANGGDYKEINLSLANSYFIVSAGLRIMNNLDLGYAYEISNSNLYQQSNGTHELMLVYTFGGRGKDGKSYDKIIDALKENQKKLNDQLETITEKVDENLAETKKTTEIAEANQEKLDVLNEKVENMPAGVEFSGDTAGVYALIAKIDQFNKQLEALDSRDGEQQKLLTDLNAEIAALRSELATKSGGTTSIPTVALTGDQNTVYFSTGSYQLSYESKLKLQKMIIYLNQNKSSKIQINGFTDEVGDEEYNKSLSASRAKTVYDYFIANGVDKERMTYTGMGEDAPQTSNKTYEGRVLNRRVEVALLK